MDPRNRYTSQHPNIAAFTFIRIVYRDWGDDLARRSLATGAEPKQVHGKKDLMCK